MESPPPSLQRHQHRTCLGCVLVSAWEWVEVCAELALDGDPDGKRLLIASIDHALDQGHSA